MTEQEDKDKEEVRYKKFSGIKSTKLLPQNDEITYKKFQGGSGNVNLNYAKITYKKFQGRSENVSTKKLTNVSHPANFYNPEGLMLNCITPDSLSQNEKNNIIYMCKRTTFYDNNSQHNEIRRNSLFQQSKKRIPLDNDCTIGKKKLKVKFPLKLNLSPSDVSKKEIDELFNEASDKLENIARNLMTINQTAEENVEWERNLTQELDESAGELNYSFDYKNKALRMYRDILNYLREKGSTNPFEDFLSEFRVKSSKYIALGLLFLTLRMHLIFISQEDFARKVGQKVSILRETIPHFYKFLKKVEGYEFVYDLIRSQLLSESEYKEVVLHFMRLCFDYLDETNNFEFYFSKLDVDYAYQLLISSINTFSDNNKYKSFYSKLKIKTPKILAVALCLICINYSRDVDLNQNKFVKILCDNKRLCINYSKFSELYGQFIIEFFQLDTQKYRNKVKTFLKGYFDDFKSCVISNFDLEENIKLFINEIDNKIFISNSMELYDSIIESGFEINFIAGNNEISYYFPQIFALSLIFYQLKLTKGIEFLGTSENFEEIFNLETNYRYITENANRIYPYVKGIIGRYKGQKYSRAEFIKMLIDSLEDFFHYETFFLLNLFEATKLKPQEFAQEIMYRGGRLYEIIDVTKNHINFIAPDTYGRIAKFIKKYISLREQNKFLSELDNLRKIRHKQFIEENVRYNFRYIEDRIESLRHNDLRGSLKKYFRKIISGDLPNAFFDIKSHPRASKSQLKGISEEQLKTYDIERYLIQPLRQDGKITEYYEDFYLCKLTQEVFDIYEKEFGSVPHHNPILNYILMNDDNSVAIETPTWKVTEKETYKGHIDLISIMNDSLRICDYKPNRTEILKSIPQICLYGLMAKNILENISGVKIKIECFIFSRNYALKFSPEILSINVLNFILKINSLRRTPLADKSGNNLQKVIESFFL